MATAAKIQRLTTGTVHFLDSSDNILATLMERARVFRLELQDLIQVVDSSGTSYFVKSTEVTDLILDPAPALPFSGTNQDLFRKMTESFFVDVVSDTSDDDLNLSSVSGETVTDALDNLSGSTSGPDTLFTIQSTNYNAVNGDYVDMTTGATNKTVTFPAGPILDDIIDVAKADSGAGNVIADGNGNNINGFSTVTLNAQYQSLTFQFNGTEWRIK